MGAIIEIGVWNLVCGFQKESRIIESMLAGKRRVIGLVRGPFLNPYDMAPYRFLGEKFEGVAFAARRCFTESDTTGLAVRRFRCVETEVSLRHGRKLHYVPWLLGFGYWLVGLEEGLRCVDLVHTAESYFGFSLQAARAARKFNRPLVVTAKETLPDVEHVHPMRRHSRDTRIKDLVHATASRYIATSQAARAALQQEGVSGAYIDVIPPAVDTARFSAVGRVQSEELRILFVGPALWRKGLFEAIRAFALLKGSRAATLTIVGLGADLKEGLRVAARLGVRDGIRVIPNAPHSVMPRLYREADVLVAPSLVTRTWQEQDSMAVLEAMSTELPVVATPGGNRRELLGDDGYWVSPGSFVEIAERLLEIGVAGSDLSRRTHRLRVKATEEHAVAVVAGQIADCYGKVFVKLPASAVPVPGNQPRQDNEIAVTSL